MLTSHVHYAMLELCSRPVTFRLLWEATVKLLTNTTVFLLRGSLAFYEMASAHFKTVVTFT